MPVATRHPPGRHRAAPPPRTGPGPVTMAVRVAAPQRRWRRWALQAWPALLPLALVRAGLHGHLAAYADGVLGVDATLCLIATLAVTPLIALARLRITRLRWWYGMWVFMLGAAGLAIHSVTPPGYLAERLAGNAVDWTGVAIVVLLFPMAATSSAASQKLLGPEWKRWQRGLVWVVWAFLGAHLALMHAWPDTAAYLAATVPLILLRHPRIRKTVRSWRAGGYSTGGMWLVLMLLLAVFAAGVLFFAGQEALYVARAVTLAKVPA